MSLFEELKRRNVIRVAVLYIVVGWLLMQVADVLFPALELPNWTIRLVFALLAIGFPAAIIFSWAFEITPEGVKRERDVDRSQSTARLTGRKLEYITIGVVIAAVVFAVADRVTRSPEAPVPETGTVTEVPVPAETAPDRPATSKTSVAVLPFVNMSADQENEFFSDGISEELLNVLVRIEGLRVPSRTSSFAFRDKEDMSIRDIARELEVDHVLEGSVRKAGNKVRVTAQLIDVRTDTHLWSDTYDRELEDIFAIQDEIATQIVDALKATLGTDVSTTVEARKQPTDDMEAYQLYLQGRYLWRQRGADEIRESIELFEQAVALDPNYAEAWGALAVANMTLPYYTRDAERTTDPAGKAAAEQALALDPTLGEAWAAMANTANQRHDWAKGLDYHRRGTEVEPKGSTGRLWNGLSLGMSGYLEKAREQFEIGHQLDPASGIHNHWLGMAYYMEGREEEALALFDRGVALGRRFALWGTVQHLLVKGRTEEAVDLMLLDPDVFQIPEEVRTAVAGLEHPEKTQQLFELMADPDSSATPVFRSMLDDYEGALESIERSAGYDDTMYYVMWHPVFAPMRQSPAFVDFAERNGFADLWRERGWADLCRPVGDSFECD